MKMSEIWGPYSLVKMGRIFPTVVLSASEGRAGQCVLYS